MKEADAAFLASQPTDDEKDNGSTCIFSVVKQRESSSGKREWDVAVSNVGDSRVIIVRENGSLVSLSHDHKPEDPLEEQRIQKAGGHVENNRVDGQLAMSRAMGDYQYKRDTSLKVEEQKVIPVADIQRDVIREGDLLLVMCDGIVECMENDEVCFFVHNEWTKECKEGSRDPANVLAKLFERSLVRGSKDNHTAILISFEQEGVKGANDTFAQEPTKEFKAGPFTPYKSDNKFKQAYFDDAKKFGLSEAELAKMIANPNPNTKDMTVFEPAGNPQDEILKMMGPKLFSDPNQSQEEKMKVLNKVMQAAGAAPQQLETPEEKNERLLREKIEALTGGGDSGGGVPVSLGECANCRTTKGTLKACSACHKVSYCSITCQRAHWKTHKPLCKFIKKKVKK